MTLKAIQCESCGGSVAFPEDKPMPECPFCGSTKQVDRPLDRQVQAPSFWLPFDIEQADADAAFREFASSSFWYPKDIRNASLELKTLLIPAWVWSGTVETHYNGQVRARSASGYRPVSGADTLHLNQVWVPSSKALTIHEINDIAPFKTDSSRNLDTEPDLPFEIGDLTERVALKQAQQVMSATHSQHISASEGLRDLQTSSIYKNMSGEPSLIPVFIGVYRRKDKFFRIVVNGTTGKLKGEAPLDWVKIVLIAVGVLCILGTMVALAS